MVVLDLQVLLENEMGEEWVQSNTDRISAEIMGRESSLLELVELLGPVLTHSKPQNRCGGLMFLTSIVEKLPEDFLDTEEVGLLVNFYTDRLKDHHSSIPHTLRGLKFLSNASKLTKDQLEVLLDRLFRELMVQQQVVRDRSVFFNIISHIIFHRFEFAKALETQLTVGLLQGGEGEKDPRNLMLIFKCTSFILNSFNIDHLKEDIFESLAVYFPIDFTPPKGVNASITKEDLISSLREGLTNPILAEFSIPLFMEKLDSDLESAKVDSIASLSELMKRSGGLELGKNGWIISNGLEQMWLGLKKELLGIRLQASESVLQSIRKLIAEISYFVDLDSGGLRFVNTDDGWRTWFGLVFKDLKPHLSVPGTRLITESLHILSAMAASGKRQAAAVLSSSLPILWKTWQDAPADARNQLTASMDRLLSAAAHTGLKTDSGGSSDSEVTVIDGFDKVVALYLETGNLQGLAGAAGLLSLQHRTELSENILSSAKDGQITGSTLEDLAKWDSDLVEKKLLPSFLDLGEKGLPSLAHLMGAGLLPQTLPSVSERICTGEYSAAAVHAYMKSLEAYSFTPSDREKLSESIGCILKNLLSWSNRPTLNQSQDNDELETFCTVIKKMSSLIDAQMVSVLSDLDLDRRIAQQTQDSILESNAIVSSLKKQTVEKSSGTLEKVFNLPGSWSTKASLINKVPSLCDRLGNVEDPEGTVEVAHALVLNGDQRSNVWLKKVLHLLEDKEKGAEVASCFHLLLSPASWLNPVTSLLFRQRAWSALHPELVSSAKSADNLHHLAALVSLLPQVPRPLLEPVLPSLLPLVTRALGQVSTAPHALACLNDLVTTSPALLSSFIPDIVPRCLKLTIPPSPLKTRLQALVCLKHLGNISNPATMSLSETVISELLPPIKDHKRLVRQEAMKARNRWYLLSQP